MTPERKSGWKPVKSCPPETEVWGFCDYEDAGIAGITHPNKFPFVCMLVPSDGEYDTHWVVYDAYGEITEDDGPEPTHWMPLPQPPEEQGRRG